MSPAALNPPSYIRSPAQGRVIFGGELGFVQCDQQLEEELGTESAKFPVCPDTLSGIAYDSGREEGLLKITHIGADYGFDTSMTSRKNIQMDDSGNVYVTGKHRTKSYAGLSRNPIYASVWNASETVWKDLNTSGWDIQLAGDWEHARFSKWIHGQLVCVMFEIHEPGQDEFLAEYILHVWDGLKWKSSNQFQSAIHGLEVINDEIVLADDEKVFTVNISDFSPIMEQRDGRIEGTFATISWDKLNAWIDELAVAPIRFIAK